MDWIPNLPVVGTNVRCRGIELGGSSLTYLEKILVVLYDCFMNETGIAIVEGRRVAVDNRGLVTRLHGHRDTDTNITAARKTGEGWAPSPLIRRHHVANFGIVYTISEAGINSLRTSLQISNGLRKWTGDYLGPRVSSRSNFSKREKFYSKLRESMSTVDRSVMDSFTNLIVGSSPSATKDGC